MITMLYAGLCTILVVFLALRVVQWRFRHKIGLGDGGDKVLTRMIRTHGNFIEHAPFALLVLALLELCGLAPAWVWGFGSALLLGRVLHALGLSRSGGYSFGRFTGTVLTWLVFLAMALAGLWLALR